MDVGTQVPHVALRCYVMGARCYEDIATADEMAAMAQITKQALVDGALGFSTSRFYGHLDKRNNMVPGTYASAAELIAIGAVIGEVGHGTIEVISDRLEDAAEQAWISELARRTGQPLLLLVSSNVGPVVWEIADRCAAAGLEVRPQVGARPASVLMTLEGTVNPMRQFPAFDAVKNLPFAEQRARLREPAFRAQVLADTAKARGVHVREALMDTMADGRPILYLIGDYAGTLEPHRARIERAHSLLGLNDRGVIAPGYRADLNLIDFQALALCEPEMVLDLPGGGRRLLQKARGYRATICAGHVTFEHGEHTGAMPGRLVRGGRG